MKPGKWFLATGIVLLVGLTLICIPLLVAYARTELTASAARITLTAERWHLSRIYTLNGVAGIPDPTQGQVHVHVLAYATRPQFLMVKAPTNSASIAQGMLTLEGTSQDETLPAGTVFTASNGMKVKTKRDVRIPAGQTAAVAATTVTPGANGNLSPYELDTSYTWSYQTYTSLPINNIFEVIFCLITVFIPCIFPVTSYDTARVYNGTAFSGGKDPAVSQPELDHAITPIVTVLTAQGQQDIQQQMQSGEQLIRAIACTPSISPVLVPVNAGSVLARVVVKCSALAYQTEQVELLAQQMLSGEAHTHLGAQYLLTGDYTTSIQSAMQTNTTVTFQVSTQGTWVWSPTDTVAQHFARLIAGKTQATALLLLQHQPGVTYVSIQTSDGMGTALPASPRAITFAIM